MPLGPGVEADVCRSRSDSGSSVVPGEELAGDFIDGAVGRGRQQATVGGEEVELEVFERDLREVFEARR